MKLLIKFTGYILVLSLMLCVPVSAFAGCKEPKRGPPGPQGPTGPRGSSFIASFGTWYIPEPSTGFIIVPNEDIIPFGVEEISQGITNTAGAFTLPNTGVYQVICGIITQNQGTFDIELSGSAVSGGGINPYSINGTINVVTVMFSATAGQILTVTNNSGFDVYLGSGEPTARTAAYISILQIQ